LDFLKNTLAATIGALVAFGIAFFMFFILLAALGSAEPDTKIEKESVLQLKLNQLVEEYLGTDPNDPFAALVQDRVGFDQILKAVSLAKTDDRIEGISIEGNILSLGWSQINELRDLLIDFKSSGKFIYAYNEMYSQGDYFLASVADSIFINPVGNLDFRGLASEVLYYKDLQEQSGVKMEVVRHGKYKSAVEPYLNDEMSDENRMQIKALLTSIWNEVTNSISEEREINAVRLNEIADDLLARSADKAKEVGLIDGLVYEDQYYRSLSNRLSGIDNELAANEKPKMTSLNKYLRFAKTKRLYKGKDRIAVLYASGTILYGEGGSAYIGQESIARALKRIREDRKVKAIVLRVNSPGGSALTSELIWRELKRTQEQKPIVVSISDVAASGGYYIAMASDYIMAQPTSITGSIGVFGTLPNFSELSKKIGITPQWVETNKQSRGYSAFGPMTQENYNEIKDGIEQIYDIFLERVAVGRSMDKNQVDELAQGRVWSASSALDEGLIDGYGGIYNAIEKAAELGETSDYAVQSFPRYKSEFEQIFGDLSEAQTKVLQQVTKAFLPEPINALNQQLEQLKAKENQIQARMPFELNIR
tara:strand:- start:21761 stop:23539 length:1779 start_codon:yes stop_codon:yes gene_type:complete